jgi:TetR/AcrR family transcriptional regulator
MARSPKQKRRAPGRPRARPDGSKPSKAELIDTAARLFAQQGFEATSLRAVARGADVTPAMIAYYFNDKAGLLRAVVVSGFELLLETLQDVARESAGDAFVPSFVRSYLITLSTRPWLPQILVREVISKQGPLRDLFVEKFATRALELIPPRVVQEISAGRLRADLDPRYAMLSLLGMCVFPFIAQPVLGPLLSYDTDADFAQGYADHVIDLLQQGIGAVERE